MSYTSLSVDFTSQYNLYIVLVVFQKKALRVVRVVWEISKADGCGK